MPEKYKILITGSCGMLGVDLCQELSSEYITYGIDLITCHIPQVTSFIECDITDKKSIESVFTELRPKIVIHTAAWTDVDGCELDKEKAYKINRDGTEKIASG